MSNSDDNLRAAHRMEQAAAHMAGSAAQMEAAAQRIAILLEDGYGGNGLRLIELLEKINTEKL